jgi:hypothetical protein
LDVPELGRQARHRLITRRVIGYDNKYWHVANVTGSADVDEALCELLTEAYELVAPDDHSEHGG